MRLPQIAEIVPKWTGTEELGGSTSPSQLDVCVSISMHWFSIFVIVVFLDLEESFLRSYVESVLVFNTPTIFFLFIFLVEFTHEAVTLFVTSWFTVKKLPLYENKIIAAAPCCLNKGILILSLFTPLKSFIFQPDCQGYFG